jgi:hypothetical protein
MKRIEHMLDKLDDPIQDAADAIALLGQTAQ